MGLDFGVLLLVVNCFSLFCFRFGYTDNWLLITGDLHCELCVLRFARCSSVWLWVVWCSVRFVGVCCCAIAWVLFV